MTKGKFGVSLSAVALIAFVFAALNQTVAVLLVVGFALLAEKNEWLNRQVVQAMLLSVVYSLANLAVNIFFDIFNELFDMLEAYKAIVTFNDIHTVVDDLLYIALIVFCIIGIVKVLGGKDANLPLLTQLAAGKEAKAKAAAPQHASVQTEAAVARFCTKCGAKVGASSAFCPNCGEKL